MTDKVIENNQVTVMGEVVSDFSYSHEIYGEGFYMVDIKCTRLSDSFDIIPVMVSERLLDVTASYVGMLLCVNGQFRSYNRHEERKNRLVLSVFAREVKFIEEMEVLAIHLARIHNIPAGSTIIITGGTPVGAGKTNFMKVITLDDNVDEVDL